MNNIKFACFPCIAMLTQLLAFGHIFFFHFRNVTYWKRDFKNNKNLSTNWFYLWGTCNFRFL